MRTDRTAPAGTMHRLELDSGLLVGNLLGDPTRRDVHVHVPADHDGAGLPLLVDLVGFTAGGPVHTNWKAFGENVPERVDRLTASGAMPPAVIAFPDCFTRLGGNQYVNSAATGPWEDILINEVLPLVEGRFGCGGQGRRAVFGKSSGGYGAMIHAIRHPEVWSAAASHSGDAGFELCYLRDMPRILRALAPHKGSVEAWLLAFEAEPKHDDDALHVLMALAMCASYDPDPTQFLGIRLPVDAHTCELIEERWQQWRAWDPVRLIDDHAEGLRSLAALWIDCGDRDQYDLVYGARRLHGALEANGVAHHYEEFDDDHTAVDYRMDLSLPYLAAALSGALPPSAT